MDKMIAKEIKNHHIYPMQINIYQQKKMNIFFDWVNLNFSKKERIFIFYTNKKDIYISKR